MTERRYSDDLIVVLAGTEDCIIRLNHENYLIITMAADEASVTVQSKPITQLAAGTDIGNTGWILDIMPTDSERETEHGVDHDIRTGPGEDVRGGHRV